MDIFINHPVEFGNAMRTILLALVVVSAVFVAIPSGAVGVAQDADGQSDQTSNDSTICFIPEDLDCDGEIDDQFRGDLDQGDDTETTCFIPEDRNCDGAIDDEFRGDNGQDNGNATICFIPEDLNCDGKIDDQFRGNSS
jgi:hypothetical protein